MEDLQGVAPQVEKGPVLQPEMDVEGHLVQIPRAVKGNIMVLQGDFGGREPMGRLKRIPENNGSSRCGPNAHGC